MAEAARIAEQAGYASIWAGDHLKCPAPVLDAPTCLAVAATVTTTPQIGLSVMLLGMRPLAWAAKQIATLQHLSGNRLRLGVGVGGEFPQEYEAAEVPHNRRGARLDEALRLLPGVSRARDRALARTACADAAGAGRRAQRPRGRARGPFGDAWLPMWVSPETLAQRGERLAELAQTRSAHPQPLVAGAGARRRGPARARAQAEAHLRGQYGMALDRVERWTAFGGAEQVAEFLEPYARIGVSEILLLPLGSRPLEQIERLADAAAEYDR